MKPVIVAIAAALLAATSLSAMAADTTTDKPVNSSPGVQGPPDTRTGPSTRTPSNDTGTSGTATGAAGTPKQPMTSGGSAGVTQPSQDASGVQGAPGNKNGPAAKQPGSTAPPAGAVK